MTGIAAKSSFALGLEPGSSLGRQPILASSAVATSASATNQPAGATGVHPYFEISGLSTGTSATVTVTGKAIDGVTAVTDTSPAITIANADPDGVFRWVSPKIFGSFNVSGITASSVAGALANATWIIYGFVASTGIVIPGKFLAEKKQPPFSPADFRALLDKDVRMAALPQTVEWSLESALYPETDQFFPYMSVGDVTNPATPATLPATPTALHASASFTSLGASYSLTTQPTAPDMLLQFVIASNALAGTFTISGTNRQKQAISEVISITAATPNGTFSSRLAYASVPTGGIAVAGFTAAATCVTQGVFAQNPIWTPTDTLLSAGGEWFDGSASHVLSYMLATDWELAYDVEKELKFTLKGEAQDMQETGDRTRASISASDFAAYTQPSDYPFVAWPGQFWLDPINGTAQTTQWLDVITFKVTGKTGEKLYMTSSGTRVKNRNGRSVREESFEAEIDFTNVALYSRYTSFQKQIVYVKFQQPYYLTNNGGVNTYKLVQVALWPIITEFKIEPKDDKIVASIKGTCEYEPSVGYAFNVSMMNQNSINYPNAN